MTEYVKSHIECSSASAVTVGGTGLTTIATISNRHNVLLCFHFDVATQNVDDFQVYGRAHTDAQLQDLTPTWSTLTTATGRFLLASVCTTSTGAFVDTDLDTVATTQNGYFEMDVTGLSEIVVKASAAADSASVTPRWSLS